MENPEINLNEQNQRFEMETEGHNAFIEYELRDGNVVVLTHTKVPSELEGRGVGKKLVELVLNHLKANNQKLVSKCKFVSAYLKRHPEWENIIAE